VIYELKF